MREMKERQIGEMKDLIQCSGRNSSHVSAASHISPAPQGWLQIGEDGDTLPRLESAFIPNLSAL